MRSQITLVCWLVLSLALAPAVAFAVDPIGHWAFNGNLEDAVGGADSPTLG